MPRLTLALILGLLASPAASWTTPARASLADDAALERFEKTIRPLLADKCWRCHGAEQSKGGLRLDSAEAFARGGEAGPVLDPEHPDQASLLAAVRYDGDLKMPPKGKLADAEIAALDRWVREGAAWPETPGSNPAATPATGTNTAEAGPAPNSLEAGKSFWAFQPVRDPHPPEVKTEGWAKSPIDRFILAALEAKGIAPAPPVDKRTLIRRATFDLIGLPPTPAEIDAFLADPSPEAFAGVVNRLLASERYGERWGRHWLDLARYADSNGMDENVAYSNAWRYRDYVIKSLNADKPYDQFVREQIAGDLMPDPGTEDARNDLKTATGFLVIGPKMLAEDDPMKMEMDIIDEQVDTVGRVFMGLTMGCARCHDHKFDPIPTADYYSLAGIFKSTKSMANHKVVAMWNEATLESAEHREAMEKHGLAVAAKKDEVKAAEVRAIDALRFAQASPPRLADMYTDPFAEVVKQQRKLGRLEAKPPAPPSSMAVVDQESSDLRIHVRGNHMTLGEPAPRRFLQAIDGDKKPEIAPGQSGRLQLAKWLSDPKHPLTARVMANRLWHGHFGIGLVRSPDNFGRLGDIPVHGELLDWLATRFVESGWSIKSLHRAIMLSSTYQMSTADNPAAALADPEIRLHWKMPRRRLEAEAIRDALLAVSGELDTAMKGTFLKTANHAYVRHTGGGDVEYANKRRSVYLPIIRSGVYDVFQAFDFADPSTSNGLRIPTTVAPQALFMMNDPLVLRTSEALANKLLADATLDDPRRIDEIYAKAFGRAPLEAETRRALGYLDKIKGALAAEKVAPEVQNARAWQGLCQAILASSEFLFVD